LIGDDTNGLLHMTKLYERDTTSMIGRKFTRLTVLEYAGAGVQVARQPQWRCVCDCGQERVVYGYALTSGHTRSCGCLQREAVANLNKEKRRNLSIAL